MLMFEVTRRPGIRSAGEGFSERERLESLECPRSKGSEKTRSDRWEMTSTKAQSGLSFGMYRPSF